MIKIKIEITGNQERVMNRTDSKHYKHCFLKDIMKEVERYLVEYS